MSGRFEKKKTRSWRSWVGIAVALVLALVLAAGVWAVSYYNSMLDKLDVVEVPTIVYTRPQETQVQSLSTEPVETTEATQPHVASSADYLNILLVGQAAREGEEERFADTAILCTLNTHTKELTMTSLLRDSFVKMPNYRGHSGGRIKLTTIYHLGSVYGDGVAGSMELMNLTLFENFGIEVDHNFEIDFESFVRVVDKLDGIEIELTQAEADYLNDDGKVFQTVQPGLNTLEGMTALSYARMRKAEGDGESDIVRTSRQRKFMEAVLAKMKTRSLSQLQDLAEEILPMITTSMSKKQITDALLTLLPMLPELKIQTGGTCPVNYWGDMVDIYSDGMKHSVLRFDQTQTIRDMRAITEGETP